MFFFDNSTLITCQRYWAWCRATRRPQPVQKTPRWQVEFAGEWHECSPPLVENSPGWVRVQLTDRRTHSRVIVRPADEIRQV